MECEAGRLHQNSDFCRVDFQPFKEEYGGPLLGRILVTPLGNKWCCFIRFDTGDLASLEGSGRCPCGRRGGIILSTLEGRRVNLTQTVGGRPVTLRELDDAAGRIEGISQYRMVQTDRRTYELSLVTQNRDEKQVVRQAQEEMRNLYGNGAVVNVIFAADYAPEPSGKSLISRAMFPIDAEAFLK